MDAWKVGVIEWTSLEFLLVNKNLNLSDSMSFHFFFIFTQIFIFPNNGLVLWHNLSLLKSYFFCEALCLLWWPIYSFLKIKLDALSIIFIFSHFFDSKRKCRITLLWWPINAQKNCEIGEQKAMSAFLY